MDAAQHGDLQPMAFLMNQGNHRQDCTAADLADEEEHAAVPDLLTSARAT